MKQVGPHRERFWRRKTTSESKRERERDNSLTVPNNNVESHKQGDKTNTRQPTLALRVDRVRSTAHPNLTGMRETLLVISRCLASLSHPNPPVILYSALATITFYISRSFPKLLPPSVVSAFLPNTLYIHLHFS